MSTERIGADEFEQAAAARVADLGLDLTTFRAMFVLLRASTSVFGRLESDVHRPAGWSLAGFRALFTLWVYGSLEVGEIARLSGLSKASVSAVLNTLERDGLARRRPHPTDGRRVTVELTDDGERRLRDTYAAQNARERSLLGDLDDAEIVRLTDLLRRVLAHPTDAAAGDSSNN